MKKLLSQAKFTLQDPSQNSRTTVQNQPSQISPPTPKDLLRYRYHHGTNLGSIFVLEKWLHGSMFPSSSKGGSELDAVASSVEEIGVEKTREKWEEHWKNAVREEEWEWLVNEGRVTSIRLPVGYFTLGPQWCKCTPFERVGKVYENSWGFVKEFVRESREWGIGVLIDLHAVYGGANCDAHSGSGNGKAELWGNRSNLKRAKDALGWIASELKGLEGVIGIQVCNEAVWNAQGMYAWYKDVISKIGKVDETIPIYVSDGWNLKGAVEWCNNRKVFGSGPRNPVVVDTHMYFTFTEEDRSQSPHQIIERINGQLWELGEKGASLSDRGETQVVVGEWSCVMDGQTWGRARPEQRDGLIKQFGQTQSKKWQQKAGGSYFWTYKMDWMGGGEWGFVEQTKKGNIPPPSFLTLPAQEVRKRAQAAQGRREEMARAARHSHDGYWDRMSPGKKFEHALYSEGWDLGFTDAQNFFIMRADGALGQRVANYGGDKIGCLEIWVKKRLLESGQNGQFVWEWEQGFRAGVGAFTHCVGFGKGQLW
jgi:aryl-phospho-beta-D-glucosidase BglC (GH1 family)